MATTRRSFVRLPTVGVLILLTLCLVTVTVGFSARHDLSTSHKQHRENALWKRQESQDPSVDPDDEPGQPPLESASSSSAITSSTPLPPTSSAPVPSTSSTPLPSTSSPSSTTPIPSSSTSESLPPPPPPTSSVTPSTAPTSSTETPSSTAPRLPSTRSVTIASGSLTTTSPVSRLDLGVVSTTFSLEDESSARSSQTTTVTVPATTTDAPELKAVGASSSGFFGNKAAVIGVFVVVGLLGIGLVGFFAFMLFKKRRESQRLRQDEGLFGEKHSDGGYDFTPSASIHGAPLNAFTRREVAFDDPTRIHGRITPSAYNPYEERLSSSSHGHGGKTSPNPPKSSQSHESRQSVSWTPSASHHSHSPSPHTIPHKRSSNRSPAQQWANPFEHPTNYAAATNTDYYGMRGATPTYDVQHPTHALHESPYGGLALESAYETHHDPYRSTAGTPVTGPYDLNQARESVDSFFGPGKKSGRPRPT